MSSVHSPGSISPAGPQSRNEISPQLTPGPPPNSPEAFPFEATASENGSSSIKTIKQPSDEDLLLLATKIPTLNLDNRRQRAISLGEVLPEKLKKLDLEAFHMLDQRGDSDSQCCQPPADYRGIYELRKEQGKGYGAYALRHIERGTRILADKPLLSISESYYFKKDIEMIFSRLEPSTQKQYFELASAHGQDEKQWPSTIDDAVDEFECKRIKEQHEARIGKDKSVISIFQTNCMEMGSGAAVFYHASRFNHSCCPNSFFSYKAKTRMETIHAVKDIKAGEEITLCYCDPYHDRTLRRWELRHYGFVCHCAACGDALDADSWAAQSAQRRYRLEELNSQLGLFRGHGLNIGTLTGRHIPMLLEMVNLQLAEEEWTDRLSYTYVDIALICEENGEFTNALVAASKALQIQYDCRGGDHEQVPDYLAIAERIRKKLVSTWKDDAKA